jgi:hypothetical protein
MELYLHSSIRLHRLVLSTVTTFTLPFIIIVIRHATNNSSLFTQLKKLHKEYAQCTVV